MIDTPFTTNSRHTGRTMGSRPAPPSWKPIATIVLVALLVRGAAMWESRQARLVLDEQLYLLRANALLDGEGFLGSFQSWVRHPDSPYLKDLPQYPGAYQPPAYVVFLAAVLGATGRNVLAAKAAQVLLSGLTVLLVYAIGRSWFDRRRGLIAAGICALYPNLIAFSHYLWTETFFIFVFLLAVWLLTRRDRLPTTGACLIAGLLLGIAALTRSAIVYFLPVLLIWFVAVHRDRWRAAGVRSVMILAATAVTILPWTVRNCRMYDAFVLLDTNGPFNLWRGNAPTTFKFSREASKYRYSPPFQHLLLNPVGPQSALVLTALARQELGIDQPTDLQVAAFAKQQALAYIRADPVAFVQRAGVKLIDMWNPTSFLVRHFRLGAYGTVHPMTEFAITWAAVLSYVLVMFLGAIGWYHRRRDGRVVLVMLLVGYFSSIHAVVFGLNRFRLPLMPFIILLAAHAACVVYDSLWRQRGEAEVSEDVPVSGSRHLKER